MAISISVNLVRTITAQIENADQSSANAMMPIRIRSPRQSAIANPAAGTATMACITRSVGATTPRPTIPASCTPAATPSSAIVRRTRRRSSGSASSAGTGGAGKMGIISCGARRDICRHRAWTPWPALDFSGRSSSCSRWWRVSARRCFSARSGRRGGRRRRRRACGAGASALSVCSSRSRPVRPSSCWRRRSNPRPGARNRRGRAGGPGRGCGVGAPLLVGSPAGVVA